MGSSLAVSQATTNIGRVRQHNEDVVFSDDALGMYAVFDGMGGAANGDVAAALARDAVVAHVKAHLPQAAGMAFAERIAHARGMLGQAAQAATRAVFDEARRRRDRRGMGTTMVVALAVGGRRFVICGVGDSRAYLVRDAGILQITKDHTVVADLIERGVVVPADAKNHPFANVLSRNIGAKETTTPDLFEIELEPGERLLLCSDGLTGYASLHEIEQCAKMVSRSEAAEALVAAAMAGGGGDNISVVIVDPPARGASSVTRIMQTLGPQVWQVVQAAFVAELQRATASHAVVKRAARDMANELGHAIAADVMEQRVSATQALLESWLVAAQAHGAPFEELVEYVSDAARIAESSVLASSAEPMAIAMVLDAVLRCFVAANGQIATMLAHDLRELNDQIAAQRWRHRDRSGAHSFADVQTQVWRTVVPQPETKLSEDARRIVAMLESKLRAAPRELRLYAHGMCEIASGGDAATVATQIYGDRQLERAAMAELWHRATQAIEYLGFMVVSIRMRQTLPLPAFYNELTMALAAASYRLMRELAACALETIAEVREEYRGLEAQSRAQTKRPTLQLFAFEGDGGKV